MGLTLSRSHLEGNKNIQIVLNKIQDERLKADGLKAILLNVVLTQSSFIQWTKESVSLYSSFFIKNKLIN